MGFKKTYFIPAHPSYYAVKYNAKYTQAQIEEGIALYDKVTKMFSSSPPDRVFILVREPGKYVGVSMEGSYTTATTSIHDDFGNDASAKVLEIDRTRILEEWKGHVENIMQFTELCRNEPG